MNAEPLAAMRRQLASAYRMQLAASDVRTRSNWAALARSLREQIERLEAAAPAEMRLAA